MMQRGTDPCMIWDKQSHFMRDTRDMFRLLWRLDMNSAVKHVYSVEILSLYSDTAVFSVLYLIGYLKIVRLPG